MLGTETIEDFYLKKFNWLPENLGREIGHFNVFRLEDCWKNGHSTINYSRRDFYKIALISGRHRYHYADKSIETSGITLIFFNPRVPYLFEPLSENATGYFCIFKESFFSASMRGDLSDLPVFMSGGKPSYSLDEKEKQLAGALFVKMLDEIATEYRFKYDLIRNYVDELIHFALKLEPSQTLYEHPDANSRITSVFTELLERQFPIETPSQRFSLRSAKDFADQLAIHVNHLNRAIRKTTGKTTTHHIAERLTAEAKALLKHTDWNVSEIAYSLGFEEPSNFNNFFKKQTQITPSAFRTV